jgi:hypothetical protein
MLLFFVPHPQAISQQQTALWRLQISIPVFFERSVFELVLLPRHRELDLGKALKAAQ